ncbi:putative porin [Croceitalea sp. MTPC9]|uniref:putative porin n=1 Tax=unclassified Croceitalea TaxID=2632280 RepID=UPI002B3DD60E|nr:putative porin [Croceitalea sp. MTPC6]GMN17107.1 putative porin [Croceitalea sp. MTPC9]
MKYTIFAILFFAFLISSAQVAPNIEQKKKDSVVKDSIGLDKDFFKSKEQKQAKPITVEDYRIISFQRDTISLDTTLSIKKEYKYNYLRTDDFELMPFSNVGQPYNLLGKSFDNTTIYPKIGAVAKHQKYFEIEDVPYYNVATPLTELMFKTTFEQGQFLDAMLTLNTSERLNVSLAFTGSRSLGKYQFDQSEAGIFRTTFSYRTKNNRYWIRGHYASQDIETEENGGISDKELQFESGDEEFLDRSRIDVAYTNADNRVLGKRYFLNHQFNLVRPKRDSIKTRSTLLAIGHQFSYESKFYQFNQSVQNFSFGETFDAPIADRATLKTLYNQVSANFSNKTLGSLSGNLNLYNYNYFFNSLLILDNDQAIQNKLEGEEVALGADYKNKIGRLILSGSLRYNLSGELSGNLIDASAKYQITKNNAITASVHGSSRAPNFNFLLYQSDYTNFNWQNDSSFEKQQTQSIVFGFDSKFFGNISAKYSAIDNYTYFTTNSEISEQDITDGNQNAFVRPFQETETINYLKVKYQKELKWRKWALNNTLMYQEVTQTDQVLNVPQFVTRNSLYFSSDVFDKAMFIQTGVTFKYFTSYNMDAYHPLLGEFYTQNNEELGGFPLIDFFINAKVRQTRIFLKAEHLNTIWSKQYNYYSAPNYPYRDFVIRFGLVWNFFS